MADSTSDARVVSPNTLGLPQPRQRRNPALQQVVRVRALPKTDAHDGVGAPAVRERLRKKKDGYRGRLPYPSLMEHEVDVSSIKRRTRALLDKQHDRPRNRRSNDRRLRDQ